MAFTKRHYALEAAVLLQSFAEFFTPIHISKHRIAQIHNGENDSHKRQFLALGVSSKSWKLNNLSKKISCQIDWCYKLLATI